MRDGIGLLAGTALACLLGGCSLHPKPSTPRVPAVATIELVGIEPADGSRLEPDTVLVLGAP